MQTDKNTESASGDELLGFAEETGDESTLRWLLEMDMSEPEEKLFRVEADRQASDELTSYERDVASRPMIRGAAGADDLENYIEEEIVISSDSQTSDIYSAASEATPGETRSAGPTAQENMAIDFSRPEESRLDNVSAAIAEGMDILGLDENDDMGETFLVIRRKKAAPASDEASADESAVAEPPAGSGEAVAAGGSAAVSQGEESPQLRLVGASGADAAEAQSPEPGPDPVDADSPEYATAEATEITAEVIAELGEAVSADNAVGATPPAAELEQPGDDACLPEEAAFDDYLIEDELVVPDEADLDDIFADMDEVALPTAGGAVEEALAEPAEEQALEIFSEDIFSEELGGDLGAESTHGGSDIDAAFDSFADAYSEGDDICGLEVEAFSEAGEVVETTVAEESEVEEPDTAPDLPAVSLDSEEGQPWYLPAGVAFAESSPGSGEIFPDFLDAFIEEGTSELEKLEDAVVAWERDCASEQAYAAVTRILHTMKGIAKGVGLHSYGTLVHNFETLLGAVARPEQGGDPAYFRLVNAWLDAVVRGLDHIRDNRCDIANTLPQPAGQAPVDDAVPMASDDARETAAEVQPDIREEAAVQSQPAEQRDAATVQASNARDKQQSKQLADEGARALAAQQSVRITSEKLDHLLNLTNQAQQLGVRTSQGAARSKRSAAEMLGRLSSVRSHIASIADRALRSVTALGGQPGNTMDALEMDQYSELQEAANILREGVEDLADLVEFASRQNLQVEALLKQQANVISSIGSAIRAARVVPVSRLVPGLRRLVRTVSVDLGKTVSFQVLNELGTLDRDDHARCQTILDHMMRNALDHGIESEEERIAAGKPAEGQVTIDIRKAGADAIITLSDDGRGIDPQAMRDSARRKGLDVDVDSLTDEEAQRLIFHKGFSTAHSVSQISGRGVGMDIVLSELQEMGGDIRIESEVGKGTSFHIRVPSSITVNGALMVTAAEHSYALPLGGLAAVEQVPVADFLGAVENGTSLSLAGRECEPAYLGTLCQTVQFPDAKTWRDSVPVIIAGSDERYMAIAVDDVEEVLEMVIRSLGTQFSAVPGVAGAATTASGEAVVALDLNMLVASVGNDDHSTLHVEENREEALLALVVDDSRTQRMVATSQLETVGVETITAENGGVAIDLLNTADRLPDIILMDVEMPVKDGIQTLREIRKSIRYGHIPVIMITSRTGLKHRSLAETAGCNGYMGKPFNFRMLVGQINELTGNRLQLS